MNKLCAFMKSLTRGDVAHCRLAGHRVCQPEACSHKKAAHQAISRLREGEQVPRQIAIFNNESAIMALVAVVIGRH